jgi:hypothetical protein
MNDLEFFYNNAIINERAAPFSKAEILSEHDPIIRKSMIYIIGLLGLKQLGKAREHLENEIESSLLGKALAQVCAAKYMDTSQCVAMINQLFQ